MTARRCNARSTSRVIGLMDQRFQRQTKYARYPYPGIKESSFHRGHDASGRPQFVDVHDACLLELSLL